MFQFLAWISVFILIFINLKIVNSRPEYTSKEKAALIKRIGQGCNVQGKGYMLSNPYLIRWIRARDFDLNAANKMLLAALKWRKENKIDGILDEKMHEFQSQPFYLDGIDKEGSTIFVMIPARVDMRKILLSGKRAEAIRFWDHLCESGEQGTLKAMGIVGNSSDTSAERPDVSTVVMDLHGYSLRQHATIGCFAVYLEWFQHLENYYPGYAKHLFMVNVPRIAIPLVELLKPAMSAHTRDVLQVYGTNKNEWIPVLRKIIPEDQVRANLGGTKSD